MSTVHVCDRCGDMISERLMGKVTIMPNIMESQTYVVSVCTTCTREIAEFMRPDRSNSLISKLNTPREIGRAPNVPAALVQGVVPDGRADLLPAGNRESLILDQGHGVSDDDGSGYL